MPGLACSMPEGKDLPNDKRWGIRWGFCGKSFWDLLHLSGVVGIPIAVAVGVSFASWAINDQQQYAEDKRAEVQRETEEQRAQGEALQAYLEEMGNLILDEDPRGAEPDEEVRLLARARTLSVLSRVDSVGKRIVVQFLYEAQLIGESEQPYSDTGPTNLLQGADLSGADLSGINLRGAALTQVDLSNANLTEAVLIDADLSGADLTDATLIDAELGSASLHSAQLNNSDLRGAYLQGANLKLADLSGAILSRPESPDRMAEIPNTEQIPKQAQIDLAIGDEETVLPDELQRPEA
jgi:uncharacterized protein YjbI with pentapeptide repeats